MQAVLAPYQPSTIFLTEQGRRIHRKIAKVEEGIERQTGAPQRTAQAILGHGSSKTTDQYIHSVPESERRVMDKVAELLFPSVPNFGKRENGSKHLPN